MERRKFPERSWKKWKGNSRTVNHWEEVKSQKRVGKKGERK
jgi:hypothetical protein